MTNEFIQQGCNENISKLIRTFLSQLSIIHQVNREYCLVPSAIDPDPALSHRESLGCFPRCEQYHQYENRFTDSLDRLPSVDPLVCNSSAENMLVVKETGLIFRRMILLPPIASGFWSKLIALCLQKQDFQQIILQAIPNHYTLHSSGPAHRLRSLVGNLELSWMYWKTGIILYVSETAVMEVHSLRSHEFEDPNGENEKLASVYKSRIDKMKNFCYQSSDGWSFIPPHFKEVIEIVIPEVYIVESRGLNSPPDQIPPTSSKILVKALEIVDEVLKNHCEHFASTGIYSLNDMIHVIPCPIDYGDIDKRPRESPFYHHGNIGDMISQYEPDVEERQQEEEDAAALEVQVQLPEESICVFTIEACIRQTFTSDEIVCPKCGTLEMEYLAPDLVFADIADFRLDKEQLSQPVTREDKPVAKGAFGIVYRRTLQTKNEGIVDVAVKLFDQIENVLPQSQVEVTRSYSDMRYELNKLGSLQHPHIIKFIGVFTNPHCFVLEWAPLLSLEYQRDEHYKARSNMCYTSILYILMQVTSALSYLHSPHKVGIVHRDLKCSNILVFKFPVVGHKCFIDGKQEDCRVLIKVTDMGICANPLASKAKAIGGLRLLVPECITTDPYRLTEKVDIFSLGSCLYELMTLRTLPPEEMGEPQYKHMLLSGRRPQFYATDTVYPPLLFQLLEDCWHQEHYLRPSAEHLYFAIRDTACLSISQDPSEEVPQRSSLLLDSFTLRPGSWVSASHCCGSRSGGVDICTALSGQDGCTSITYVQYDRQNERSELKVDTIETIKNIQVASLQITPDHEIFVGCRDGTIFFYNADGSRTSLILDPMCQQYHGSIVKVYYCSTSKLIIAAFDSGKVHIRKCTQGLTSSSNSTWRESCSSLSNNCYDILDVECVLISSSNLDYPVFEVWFGLNADKMEIWRIPIQPDQIWISDTVSQTRSISCIRLSSSIQDGMETHVRKVKKSQDESMIVAVVYIGGQSSVKISIICVKEKSCLRTFDLDYSVSSLLLTSSLLAIGSYEGKVYIYETPNLIDPHNYTVALSPKVIHGHYDRVYALHLFRGCIEREGYSSLFPTFIGQATDKVGKDFLVSVGFGRGYPSLKKYKVFNKSNHTKGCYVNSWMI